MNRGFILRVLSCILFAGFCLYSFIDVQNSVTELRIKIPQAAKELKAIQEESDRLRYEIEQFENPQHLMELARRAEFNHLKHPLFKEILTVKEGVALAPTSPAREETPTVKPHFTLAIGTMPESAR
ncbi:MAG: hypothetical protein HYX48_03135 [Chlamydiales bacterium]|nr:hypothetical protein [Chlamydiales bacterium]